jgi:hypothetical protein
MNTTVVIGTNSQPDSPLVSAVAELEAREATIAASLKQLQGDTGQHQQAIGDELILIRDKELYKAAGIKSFKAYLEKRRNPISRPRAYQLIDFAEQKRRAAVAGQPGPQNERQSRADGSRAQLSFERRWKPVFKYLVKKFSQFAKEEQPRFAELVQRTGETLSARPQELPKPAPVAAAAETCTLRGDSEHTTQPAATLSDR